jgi:hypothetical protein
VILNFSTIPQWMFKTDKPVPYPADPDQPVWNYTQGTELRDPSLKELADYYARLISWYTAGGFVDEFGGKHVSGYHFKIDYWEIFNEIEFEHNTTPEQYTARYDAIAAAILKVAPHMKFVALALASPSQDARYFEYFLNPKNHQPGIPLDLISAFRPPRKPPSTRSAPSPPRTRSRASRVLSSSRFPMRIGTCRGRLTPTSSRGWPKWASTSPARASWSAIRRSSPASAWSIGKPARPTPVSACSSF